MPSKGIRIYAFTSLPDVEIKFSVPGRDETYTEPNQFHTDLLEVDKDKIHGVFNFTGKFSFTVTRSGAEITTQWLEINALTGAMGDGTLHTLEQTPSVVLPDLIVTYGFYDAGQTGEAGLPKEDQCFVTVGPNNSEWMKNLVPPETEGTKKPFATFVLPAVHDVGMNSMQNAKALLQYAGDDVLRLALKEIGIDASVHLGLADDAVRHIAPNIVESLAITQKDTLQTMLAIGARYFEFRPAHVLDQAKPKSPLPDVLYFQHACIPGMAFAEFLGGLVAFLQAHPWEIIVVQVRGDGILAGCAQPSSSDLDAAVATALEGTGISRGLEADLTGATVHELRTSNKRLLLMEAVSSFSTYTDAGNATLNGDSIVAEFEAMDAAKQEGQVFTNIQCQATATNIRDAVIYSALSANASNSCLMSTKAICDAKTLPWIRDNALGKLTKEQLIVIMNDFMDGATVDTAIDLSKQRFSA